jgi:hypothetical protein
MSDQFYDEDEAWNELSAQYEEDPAATAARLAQAYAAQEVAAQMPDPVQLATAAASAVNQLNAQAHEAQQLAQETSLLDRSMSAEYGAEWANLAPKVGARLAARQDLAAAYDQTTDANERLQILDQVFQEVRADSDPDRAAFKKIKEAGPNEYWRNAGYQDALKEVQGR